MSPFSKFASWLPQALIAFILVAGALSLPEVTQTLRVPVYRAWNFMADPGEPPSRVLYLQPKLGNPSPEELKAGLRKMLQARPAAVAISGYLVGLAETGQSDAWPLQQWMPGFKNAAPIIVGFPWSDLRPDSNLPDLQGGPWQRVQIKAPLQLPVERGLSYTLPQNWAGQVSLGYLEPKSSSPLIELSLFRRMPQGIAPSLGVETLRRALRLPEGPLPYVEGIGGFLGKSLVLPFSMQGQAPLAVYRESPLRTSELLDWDLADVPDSMIQGNVVFIGSERDSQVLTYSGFIGSTGLAAHQAANLLGRNLPVTMGSARILTLGAGLVLTLLAILGLLWFGKSIGLALALGLSLVFPGLSLVFFLASHWWLAPEFPFVAVWAGTLPFLLWPKTLPGPSRKKASKMAEKPAAKIATSAKSEPAVEAAAKKDSQPSATSGAKGSDAHGKASPAPKTAHPDSVPTPAIPKGLADIGGAGQVASPQPSVPVPPAKASAPGPTHLNPPLQPSESSDSKDVEYDSHRQLIRLGRYKIIRKMGQGSAGEVYEAVDLQMGRRVAVKTMIQTAQLHFDRAFERFLVEARAAGSLNHPNINTIHDFGSAGHISYMVLEYLDGMTLSQWMKGHPTPGFGVVSPWIEQIASALDYAHAHKVIHRDLKPSNLMVVNENQQIKLLDFGVAKFGDVMLTRTGMTVGTPTYMSPEQLQGLKVGPGSDQYTLAVLVYQLLTYKLPYAGQKIPEICNRILKGEFIPIRDAKPELPNGLWLVLQRAFARNPEDRFPSCSAFHLALQAAMKTSDLETVVNYGSEPQA